MSNKYFDLLPVQHQTSVNKNFFESTVEQLFAKANLEDVKGFIGRKIPGVDNNTNTVFVEQPAPNREYYSLEPTVTTINKNTGRPDNFVFYEDYIFNHRSKGGLIGNHDRIFKAEQYNFAPPIDLDKFINYQNYYWYSSGPEPIQVLGNASVSIVIDDLVGLKTFTSPNNVEFKTGMVVQFGEFTSGTSYSVGKSYIVEGVGQNIFFVDVPTAELSVSAYSEFQTQPYDGNAVPNAISTGTYSNTDPIGSSILANILTLANTNINTATFDFDIARPVDLTTKTDGNIRATFTGEYGDNVNNTNHVRINVFDKTNKVKSDASTTAYGFVGAYLTRADGTNPATTINKSDTFTNAGANYSTDTEVLTNTIYIDSNNDIYPGARVYHPDCGQATVTTVNSTNVVLSHTILLRKNSTNTITFDSQMPQFSINTGSGTKTITLDQYSSTGAELKEIDLATYTAVSNAAVIVSPLDLMDTINDVGIANLNVVATSNSIELIELNGNAVTITNITNDARNRSFVGSNNTSGLEGTTTAINSTNIENNIYEIFNKTSNSFDIDVGGAVNVLRDSNATFINYGDSTKANVQIYSDTVVQAGSQIFFDKTLGSLSAGTITNVLGTPTTKTFYISTGDTAYGGTQSSGDFTQPRYGKFNHPAYTQFLDANGSVQAAANALASFDTANIESIYADVSQTGALLTYAWDTGSWDNTPIQDVADYLVLQRGSKNKNPWSRLNYWYHVDALREPLKDNVSGFSIPEGAIRATRPILEFQRDLELYGWGNSFISTVDIVADKPKEELEGLQIGFPINSSSGSQGSTIIFPNNESTVASKVYKIYNHGQELEVENYSGIISIDDKVLIFPSADTTAIANASVSSNVASILGNVSTSGVITDTDTLTSNSIIYANKILTPSVGDVLVTVDINNIVIGRATVKTIGTDRTGLIKFNNVEALSNIVVTGGHVFSTGGTNAGKDYYWNGNRWQQAQQKMALQQAPKFTLYDDEGVKVDDIAKYPNSDFTGCPVFTYNTNDSTGTYDSILKANVVYQSGKFSSEPTFHNHLAHHTVTWKASPTADAQTIPGYLYYKDLNQDYQGNDNTLLRNNWHPVNLPTNYRNFSNTATYFAGEVVKYENNYFTANSNITAGEFSISNFDYYENSFPVTSKQYVEDIIQITDLTVSSNTFVTSAIPVNNEVIVFHNTTKLKLGTDFSIVTDNQGIRLANTVTLAVGDIINVKTYTEKDRLTNLDAYGFFEIPGVLKYNPTNTEIMNVAFGDMLSHFHTMMENQNGFTGSLSGVNNYKDTAKDLSITQSTISQTSDEILSSMYMTKSSTRDFLNALRFGNNEYVKFKNKFIGSAETYLRNTDYLGQNNLEIVDTILKTIKNSKVSKEAHKLTYMAPIGTNYDTSTVTVSDTSIVDYTFDNTANIALDTNLYTLTHGDTVLVAEKDFTIESSLPLDIKLDSSISLTKNDVLTLRVYEDSEPALIPASLSKLGIYPTYEPQFKTDTTYQTNLDVIQCHDGSYIPRQNDKIDEIILTLETLIYNNIASEYRTADRNAEYCFVETLKPSFYQSSDYKWFEINDLLENNFNKWVKANGIDWRNNSTVDSTNEFTWNYNSDFKSPGHWRGIFDFYYDTQTPHTTPWEMFGFVKKPSWWDRKYPLAVTSSNTELWTNVQFGYIPEGNRKGYHKRWARPGLVIPVDSSGNLRSPQDIIYTSTTANTLEINNNWKFGDCSPAEYAWKKSSYYPFAIAEAMYLARPALFMSTFFDKKDRVRFPAQTNQVVSKATRKRIGFENYAPHGYVDSDNNITIKFGASTLVDSFLKFQTLRTNTELADPVRTINTRLGHKFGGFVNDKTLKVFSDSLSIDGFSAGQRVPSEDVITALHTSDYNSRNFYTGVKIIKTATGYTVTGYDTVSQMFDIIPSDKAGPQEDVSEGGTPVSFSTYDSTISYSQNDYVKLGSIYYQAKENIPAETFTQSRWTRLPALPTEGGASATYYQNGLPKTAKVPYNKHFESVAEVFDLLVSIGRHQKASGYDFGEYDTSVSSVNDWLLFGRRFLFWTTEEHSINESITLSPQGNQVIFTSGTGKIAELKNNINEQYSLTDEDGKRINIKDCGILREDNTITILPPEGIAIYGCLLHTELVEHAVVFNNRTSFNDLIYDNVLGIRQDRLDLNAQRSRNWDGRYTAEGLIITNSGGVLPNFELLVDSIRAYHDPSFVSVEPNKTELARGLIGFSTDSSLSNIMLSDPAQFEFYKGIIRNKGTANSISSILRSDVVNTNKDIEINEEWAIKRGEFGDVFNHQSMDINLRQSDFITDNQQIEILYPENITGTVSNIFVYERNTTYFKVPTIEIDAPSVGNAATATAKLYGNAQLESVTITNGGDGYDAKPNVAVITGNIVVARIDEVLQNGLAFSNADVDVPLTGTSAISNISITDYTTSTNTTVDVDLANSYTIENVVRQINKQLSLANISDVVAFSDLDTDVEKLNITNVTANGSNAVILTSGTAHGFNPPSTTRANASIQSISRAANAVITLDSAGIGPDTWSTGDTIFLQNVVGGTGFSALSNTMFYVKGTGVDRQYELFTNASMSAGANTLPYTGTATGGEAYARANVDYVNVTGLSGVNDGDYFVRYKPTAPESHSTTQFELYHDNAVRNPVVHTGINTDVTGSLSVYRTGGDKRLYIRGADFQLAESTLPGGNPSTSLSVLNMTAGRYQPQQRFPIQTANNTTTSDIIVTIGGTSVTSSFFTFDVGARTTNLLDSNQINQKLSLDQFTVDLTGTSNMLNENVVERDGQYPYIEFYIDGQEIKNTPSYRAVTVSNAIAGTTRVTFSNVSQYANAISIGANVTIAEMGTVQFANTLTTDTPGSKLVIKSVANDTLIANTTSKRTYKVVKDDPTDNRITIDIDNTAEMLKRPTNTVDKGIWPTSSNTQFSIPNAGYVNRANVEWEAYDIQNFANRIGSGKATNPKIGQYVHLAKAENEDWNVYRLNLHGSQTINGDILPAQNFVDTTNGQTNLFTNSPLSVYTDSNNIDNPQNTSYFDNHIIVKNAELANIVLKWSNEQLIATPRTIYTGTYVPLKPINRKILSIKPGASGNITAALPNTNVEFERRIFAKMMVPLSNVEYFRNAGISKDRRLANVNNSVQIVVDNIEGLESSRRSDNDASDIVRFYGAGATAANLTVGKAYTVNDIAPPNEEDNGAGIFYITEANITATSYARLGSDTYVSFESQLREDSQADIIGITPSTKKVLFKGTSINNLTNGTNISLTSESTLSSVDTIPAGFYSAADVNTTAKTFTVTNSNFLFHDATVSRGVYNQLNLTTVGNGDSKGNTYISNAGTDGKIGAGDFVHFVSGTNYAGNVYPIQSVTSSGVAQFYDNGVTASSGSQNAVVYTGNVTSIQGDVAKLFSNGTIQINNFDTSSMGAYGYGNVRYLNSNTSISGSQGNFVGLTNSKQVLKKTNVANVITIANAGFLKPLTTAFKVDVQKDTTNNLADIRLREDVTAGDVSRLLFETSRKTSNTLEMLKNAKINYGTQGNGIAQRDFNSMYKNKPMYVGALAKDMPMTLQSIFSDAPESFRSVDDVEVELEFRYITQADLEILKNLTVKENVPDIGSRTYDYDFEFDGGIGGEYGFGKPQDIQNGSSNNYPTLFQTDVDVDWWVDTYTKPLTNPSLDGFYMSLLATNGGTEESSKIDLIPRYIGEHNSYNLAAPENKLATVAGFNNLKLDTSKPTIKFKFSDKGRGQEVLSLVGRQKNHTNYHRTQEKLNQFFINTRGNGNKVELLPSHSSAADNPLNWWSNNVKSTFTQDALNKFRLEFGYKEGVSLYPLGTADDVILPVIIVKDIKVNYTLAPVTALKLDNLRVSLTGGSITGVVDKKVENADSTFISVDNSDSSIASDDTTGSVKAVFYRIDKDNNKQVLVNNLGAEIVRSDVSDGGYSSMLLTTANANSYLNTGTVFGYVPQEREHMTSSGSLMLGIPGTSTKSITEIFDNDFGAEIKYVGLNRTGKTTNNISSVNVAIDTHTVKNESKLFGSVTGLANADVLNIDDTINSPGALDGQTSISNVQASWFSIPKGITENVVATSIPEASNTSVHAIANSSVNNTLLTINNDNHQLIQGSKVIFYATNQSHYLNNTSFIVRDVTSNTFTINVANTSVIPTTNVAGLKYGAVYNTPSGNLDTQYYVSGQHVAHLACYNDNNVFVPGDNITFNAGSVDTASLNNTTAEVVSATSGSLGVVLSSRPTNLTSNLTVRYTNDLTKHVVTMPPKYNINNLYARINDSELSWSTFTGFKEINLSTYDSTAKNNLNQATFNTVLGTTVPKDEVYLPMVTYDATKFISEDHGVGKTTVVAQVRATTNASSEGFVNVVIADGGRNLYKQGKLKFSNSINGHALSGNTFDIIDFITKIDEDGDQGEQYYTIKAPGATATTNEFSVSYEAYRTDKDRALRFIKAGKYTGFGVPIELAKDSITIETPYLGDMASADAFWVNDIMLVEGSSDLSSEMKLRPKLDSLVIKNSKIRSYNAKYKIAPSSYASVSPQLKNPQLGSPSIVPIRGFAHSKDKVDFSKDNVTYSLDGWNSVKVNGAKTSLARADNIEQVSDSLNFAARLKEGAILSSGSIQLGFMFGRRNHKVDNYKSGTYNSKFVQVPKNTENLEKIFSSEYANTPTGNALKNGVNRWTTNVIKRKGGRPGEADLRGTYMHDMDNLDDIIHRGAKASKMTRQGSGHVQIPSLDQYASKNKYVKQSVNQSQNSYLNPSLKHVKNKNIPDYGSPHIDISEGWIMHNGGGGVGWYDGIIDIPGTIEFPPYTPPSDGTTTPPADTNEPTESAPDCGAFDITLYDINNPGEAAVTQEYDQNLLAIAQAFIDRMQGNHREDEVYHATAHHYGDYVGPYANGYGAYGGYLSAFISAGGSQSDWTKYLSYLYGNAPTSEVKVPYNSVTVDLCDADPGYVKEINGNLCTNSGEVMFLGNQRISLTENCDPCALADGINSQNSDYRAICGEPTKEPVNCVIPGGGQAWGETDFGETIDSTTGRYLIEDTLVIGGRKAKVKKDNPRYTTDCWGETTTRHEPIKVEIKSTGPGQGFAGLVEQVLIDKGIDPIEGGYKSIVLRLIQSAEKKGDIIDKKIIGNGSGTTPVWYDIRKYGKDTCNWENVNWMDMKSKGGTGLKLKSAEIRVKGWKGGLSWYKAELHLSKHTGTQLKNMNRDLTRSGTNHYKPAHFGQNAVLGLLFRQIMVGDGTLPEYVKYEDYTSDEGWKYKKIVGYGDKMTDPYSGGHKDRTYYSRDNDGSGYFFQKLWDIHPVQQRRKAGCFGDIDIPVLQNVKIKSAVPFSLGMGCSRSPFSEVGDFMPYVDKTSISSANLALGANLTNEELQLKSTGTGFSAPKVLTTKATGSIQVAEAVGVPSQSNPFMTADYLRIDGLATTPRSGEGYGGLYDAPSSNANIAFNSGEIQDSTGFNYRIGDKLQIVGGQPKTIDNTAYYLDKVEIQNSGVGYNPADTRFEIVDEYDDGVKLPGVSVRGVFSPDTDKLEPALKVTGRTASAYHQSFYRQYVETGGGSDKEWINNETTPSYVDTYTSAIEELNIELKRADIPLDGTSASDSFKITSRQDLLASNQYKAFIGTRQYENAGSMMFFGLGIHDGLADIGEQLIRNSKIYDSFSEDELNSLNGSWICCWEVPNGTVFPNGHNLKTNLLGLNENVKGLLKVFHDAEVYDSETSNEYRHFLSNKIAKFNGRIVKFLRVINNRAYFKVETTLGLEKEPNFQAYGVPDFMNLYSRFYPIEDMNTYQDQTTKSRDYQDRVNAYQLAVEIDSANSSGVTVTGSNQFSFNTAGEGYATVKVTATRPNTTEPISPIDQNWDIFIIQKDISQGYLRMPFTVHLPDELIEVTESTDEPPEEIRTVTPVTALQLAKAMNKLHYNTVYRPVSTPYIKMGESEAVVFRFDFDSIPDDAIIQNIDIDFIMRSTMPGDYGMIWLQAPDGTRIPLMQFLGQFGNTGQYDQGGFMPGHDYQKLGSGSQEMIFTVSSNQDAQTVQPNGTNLNSYASKVKPWIGDWKRADLNTGKDQNGNIYAGDYDSNNGENLTNTTGAYWNDSVNVLRSWIESGGGKSKKMKGTWYIEVTRPGRNWNLVNDSTTLSRRPDNATNVGLTPYTTAVKTPNLKISYISPSEDPNYDTANKETITRIDIVQKGGFQQEFSARRWIVKAIGSGQGFKARAILAKGELLAQDNPDLVEQSAQFEVTEINTSGSITKLRVLDRGVYEQFPAEQEKGIPLKYTDDTEASQRLEGPGFGARVICSSRSVIDCRQPPRIVAENAGPADTETPVEAIADVINTQAGVDGGLTAEVVDVNDDTQVLVLTSDGDGIELSDVVPGTLDAIGIMPGEYSMNSIGFRSKLGNPGSDFGIGDGNTGGDGSSPFGSGDGDGLVMYNTVVPPEFEGLTSSAFGNIYRYDLSNVDDTSVLNVQPQQNVDVLYFRSRRFQSPFNIDVVDGKKWIDNYDALGWAHVEDGQVKVRQPKLVDSSKLKNSLIYNKDNGERVTDLILHDPFKGFIVPEAEKNITYISDGDPVYYNNDGSNFSKANVGELWWNTDRTRVRWYEQSDHEYRSKYWGTYISGSEFNVYEWIESKDIPSDYTGKGTPLALDKYIVNQEFNRNTNTYTNLYYYWVKDLTEVPNHKDRTLSAKQVAALIRSPKMEQIPTYSVISESSMLLNNAKEYLTDDNTALQTNFARKDTKYDNKHESYILLGENAELSKVPADLLNKFKDSIAGEDSQGNAVPDTNLNKYELYGISIRPRQTMFKDIKQARRELRTFLNREIGKLILTSDIYTGWESGIATSNLYKITDWVETGYNANDIKPRLSVDTYKDMLGLTNVEDGVFIKVKGVNTTDTVYEYDSETNSYKLVKVVNGTMELKKEFYNSTQTSLVAIEIRQILDSVINIIFKNSSLTNKMYFAMLNYILTEQYQTDWFFKSSYFNIRQSADNLEQKATTKIDPFGDMSDYIKTVKPYTSKLRDFNDRKIHTDSTKSFSTDFDKPPYQPNLSVQAKILDPNESGDANIISSSSEHKDWASTYITAPSKVRTFKEKIFIDRNQSNIMALGKADVTDAEVLAGASRLAKYYNQPTSLTAETRITQLVNDPANATPVNHIERLLVHNPTIKDLNTKIANTTFSADVITGLKATRLTTLRVLAYANFLGEELDADLFSKAYYDGIGNEIVATAFGYDQTMFDSEGYDSDTVVRNYLANTSLDSQLVRDSVTYAGFDSNTFFKGFDGPDRPPEHVMLHALEGVQFNVQTVSAGSNANVSYKMMLGLNGAVEYTRIADDFSTTLANAVTKTSQEIYVTDSTKIVFPYSGSEASVIYLGDERITYSGVDGNRLYGIQRGTQGTSPQSHAVGTKIIDASKDNRIEVGSLSFGANNDPEQAYWNSASSSLADSTTHIAQFLKDKPGSYFN